MQAVTNSFYFGVFGSKVSLASKYARILALSRSFLFTNFVTTFDFWYAFLGRSQESVQFLDMRQSPAMSTAGCGPRGRPQAENFEGVRDSLGIANASPTIPAKELQLIDVGKRRWKIDSNSSIGNKESAHRITLSVWMREHKDTFIYKNK